MSQSMQWNTKAKYVPSSNTTVKIITLGCVTIFTAGCSTAHYTQSKWLENSPRLTEQMQVSSIHPLDD